MRECQLCRKATPKTITQLAPQSWLSRPEPASVTRFLTDPPSSLRELCLVEAGDCCAQYMAAELRALLPLLMEVAKDPAADVGWLCALWNLYPDDAHLRRVIMANPNVPLELAKIGAPCFFDAFMENPASLLWCLALPTLLEEIEAAFLQMAQQSPVVQRWSIAVSASWLWRLAASSDEHARCYAASHQMSPSSLRWSLSRDPSSRVRALLAYHADDDLQRLLADDPEIDVRREVARLGRSLAVLSVLARDPSFEVRSGVAINRRVELPLQMRSSLRLEMNTWEVSFL